MDDITLLIVFGSICLVMGLFAGILIASLRGNKSAPGNSKPEAASRRIAEKDALVAVSWKNAQMKSIQPVVDGQVLTNPDQITLQQRQRLDQFAGLLQPWISRSAILSNESPALQKLADDAPAESLRSVQMQNMLDQNAYTIEPAQPKTGINPIDVLARAIQIDNKKTLETPRSIAAQVEEILQEKLEGSALATRGIRLMELPDKGLVVMVGMKQYDSVDAVEDTEIRDLIRSAVSEWEKREFGF